MAKIKKGALVRINHFHESPPISNGSGSAWGSFSYFGHHVEETAVVLTDKEREFEEVIGFSFWTSGSFSDSETKKKVAKRRVFGLTTKKRFYVDFNKSLLKVEHE